MIFPLSLRSSRCVIFRSTGRSVTPVLRAGVEALEDAWHETAAAANGEEALRECARRDPDLVLLDLMMPVMSGRQFLEGQRTGGAAGAEPAR